MHDKIHEKIKIGIPSDYLDGVNQDILNQIENNFFPVFYYCLSPVRDMIYKGPDLLK